MNADEPQEEQALLARYRRARAADDARPSEVTRSAILAEARRVAAAQSRPESLKPFDPRPGAANQDRWRLAAFGTLGVALLAALLVVPLYRRVPAPAAVSSLNAPRAEVAAASEPPPGTPTAQARAPEPASRTADAAAARTAPPPVAKALQFPDARARAKSDAVDAAQAGAVAQRQSSAAGESLARRLSARSSALKSAPMRGAPASLLKAVSEGDREQVSRLLDAGASLSESDEAGRSALFLAVMQHRTDLVRLLLEHGADAAAVDRAGQTPLDWARQQHADDLVPLLSPPPATR